MHTEFVKDPQAIRRYWWDWSQLTGGGETLSSGTITAVTDSYADGAPGDLTISGFAIDGNYASALVAGGTTGKRYALLCHVQTSGGQVDEETAFVLIQNE